MSQRYKLIIAIIAVVIVADQATKAIIASNFVPGEMRSIIPGFFNLVYWRNPGAAFGILSEGGGLRTLLLFTVTCVALGAVIYLLGQSRRTATDISLSLIAGGAIGNLIDRFRLGEVVDFLDFYLGSYHWPAFNVADSAISVGVILSIIFFYFEGRVDAEGGKDSSE